MKHTLFISRPIRTLTPWTVRNNFMGDLLEIGILTLNRVYFFWLPGLPDSAINVMIPDVVWWCVVLMDSNIPQGDFCFRSWQYWFVESELKRFLSKVTHGILFLWLSKLSECEQISALFYCSPAPQRDSWRVMRPQKYKNNSFQHLSNLLGSDLKQYFLRGASYI